jgi:plasmid replication initiation protein
MKKSNGTIRISNLLNLTRQEFTVIEKHIFHATLRELKENQGFHLTNINNELPLKVVINAAEILKNSKNIDVLKEAIRKITSRSIYFDKSTPKDEYFASVVPIPYARYTSEKGSKSEILIEIHHTCKKLFLEFAGGYTTLQLDAILSLKSEHSIRMYELLSMYKNQKAWEVTLEDLRSLLGFGALEYKNFGMFENRILIYSQRELEKHCGLYFDWDITSKKGKKVTGLTFSVRDEEGQEKWQAKEDLTVTMAYVQQLSPLEISKQANMLLQFYTLTEPQVTYILSTTEVFYEYIRIHMAIENMISIGKPPRNRTAFLAKSLGFDKIKLKKG